VQQDVMVMYAARQEPSCSEDSIHDLLLCMVACN